MSSSALSSRGSVSRCASRQLSYRLPGLRALSPAHDRAQLTELRLDRMDLLRALLPHQEQGCCGVVDHIGHLRWGESVVHRREYGARFRKPEDGLQRLIMPLVEKTNAIPRSHPCRDQGVGGLIGTAIELSIAGLSTLMPDGQQLRVFARAGADHVGQCLHRGPSINPRCYQKRRPVRVLLVDWPTPWTR